MQKFYTRLTAQPQNSAYWQSLSALRSANLNAITDASTFLVWTMW